MPPFPAEVNPMTSGTKGHKTGIYRVTGVHILGWGLNGPSIYKRSKVAQRLIMQETLALIRLRLITTFHG